MSEKLLTLYHFTCSHGHAGIEKTHILLPNEHPFMRNLGPLIWLTDLPEPTRESAGLTSVRLTCDRMAFRYIVQSKAATHWRDVRNKAPYDTVVTLESFGEPDHWYVIRRPVLASEFSFDATWKGTRV